MRDGIFRRGMGVVAVTLVVAALTAAPALAAVTLETSTAYAGVEGDSQAIDSTVALSPDGDRITEVRIDIGETSSSFVDFESFGRTLEPGTADAQVTYEGNGVYTVDELSPNERLTISFNAYPRTVKSETIEVATVSVSYIQNGQSLTDRTTLTANLSNSSWFALQNSEQEVQDLQGQVEEVQSERDSLQGEVDDLEQENEELQSRNEELQSRNEELQSQNEDLQRQIDENETFVLGAQVLIGIAVLLVLVLVGIRVKRMVSPESTMNDDDGGGSGGGGSSKFD